MEELRGKSTAPNYGNEICCPRERIIKFREKEKEGLQREETEESGAFLPSSFITLARVGAITDHTVCVRERGRSDL